MKYLISILLILLSLGISGVRFSKSIQFKQNVSGYLKHAADANTIKLADQELSKALIYLEDNNLTSGHTSILYQTPDEDIAFWYENLKASQKELQTLKSESALERTNVLIKLRETLLDTGKRTRVTVPEGLSVYPNNKKWAAAMPIAVLSGFSGCMILTHDYEKRKKKIADIPRS